MLPEGWELKPLKSVTKIYDGTHQTPKYVEAGVPFYSVEHVTADQFNRTKYISEDVFERECQRVTLERNDILMTRIGDIGTAKEIDWDVRASFYVSLALIKKNRAFNSTYLENYINSRRFRSELWKRTIHVAFPKKINLGEIGNCEVLLPPLPEQKKIAQILSTWDQAITSAERLLENSQQRKKGLKQQLLTGKKRLIDIKEVHFSGDLKPSKSPYRQLPADWAEFTLSQISSFITKGATPTSYGFEWQDTGIPFIRSECVGENGFKESGLAYICTNAHEVMGRSKVFNGDILITITGNVGRTCKLPESFEEANINQHIAKITLDEAVVDPGFVFHCLQDRKYRVYFERITTGQAYPQISLVQVRDTVIPLPPLKEQQTIAAVLSIADLEISALKHKVNSLRQEKQALMQQLLTGKRWVQVEAA